MIITHISVQEAEELLKQNPEIKLLDVREEAEFEYVHLAGSLFCPLRNFTEALQKLDLKITDIIITYCHHGIRSTKAANLLAELGFENLYTMDGGIEAWSLEIDPQILRY